MTVRDLITKAFRTGRIVGAGEALSNDESSDAFDLLNGIIDQANIDKLFALYDTEIVFSLVSNQATYTVGPTGQVVAARPVEILNAFSRRNNIDQPMRVTHAKEDYDRIAMKSLTIAGWETFVYYQASYPNGTCYFFMKPSDTLTEIHLSVKAQVSPFAALGDTVDLPPGYRTWMQYKLAQRLAAEFGMPFSNENTGILLETESALKSNNVKPLPVMGSGIGSLARATGGSYNVYADQTKGPS